MFDFAEKVITNIGNAYKEDKEISNIFVPFALLLLKCANEDLNYYTPEQKKARAEGKAFWYWA